MTRLIPLVYDDLHAMASFYFQREARGHTLQPTALVNEVYLRLGGSGKLEWQNRRQFFGFAAKLMRNILVDHARTGGAQKRGNNAVHLSLEEVLGLSLDSGVDLISLNDLLDRLSEIDERQAEIVQLRFFVGLTVEETARLLVLSSSTVKREWKAARFWLYRKLTQPADDGRALASG